MIASKILGKSDANQHIVSKKVLWRMKNERISE